MIYFLKKLANQAFKASIHLFNHFSIIKLYTNTNKTNYILASHINKSNDQKTELTIQPIPSLNDEKEHQLMLKQVTENTKRGYSFINIICRTNHTISQDNKTYHTSRKAISRFLNPNSFKSHIEKIFDDAKTSLLTASNDRNLLTEEINQQIINPLEKFFCNQLLGIEISNELLKAIKNVEFTFADPQNFTITPQSLLTNQSLAEFQNVLDQKFDRFFINNIKKITQLVKDDKQDTILKTAIKNFLGNRSIAELNLKELKQLSLDIDTRTAFINLFPIFNLSKIISQLLINLHESQHEDIINFKHYTPEEKGIIVNNLVQLGIEQFTSFRFILRQTDKAFTLSNHSMMIPANSLLIIPLYPKSIENITLENITDLKIPVTHKQYSFNINKRQCPAMYIVKSIIIKQLVEKFLETSPDQEQQTKSFNFSC